MILQEYVDVYMQDILFSEDLTMGYIFTVAESVVSWKAELQDIVMLLTTEAEYMAVVEASKKGLWLRGLVGIFEMIQDSVQIDYDSQYISLKITGITSKQSILM